jgi:hypothetical protein
MQKIIPPSMSFSISDKVVWSVYKDVESMNPDLSLKRAPITESANIQSGILKAIGTKEVLLIENLLGVQTKTAQFFKIFCRDLNFNLKENSHLLKMESHLSPRGLEMPLINGYFRVIMRTSKPNSETWIYLYKIN